ncbi:hypothetical protein GCM10011297_35200 [Bacterioplanes sanyensis]|uniref:hypothetical protein n=1 Tax=Bacterioplanes sanyensis TaxID=1249553 RepID=UPI0016777457|nr:hypothetical protein [Bacterioplanes sanyensis]GGY59716.1 hypothetical protein GCM10011297_35200 [Bacterioplanes sanyensis]
MRLSCFSFLMVFSLLVLGDTGLRYDNFVFSAIYEDEVSSVRAAVEEHVGRFHGVDKIYAAEVEGGFLVLYRAEVKKSMFDEFKDELEGKGEVGRRNLGHTGWRVWDSIAIVGRHGEVEDLSVSGYQRFFSIPGIRSYDFYGCIDSRPVFSSSLIEGQDDFVFIITATHGNPRAGLISENMAISVYSGSGELQFKEKLLWVNYVPAVGGRAHYYGEGEVGSKYGELPISDGYGRKRYAKMYIADFDLDDRLDVVFWFKTFKSTSVGDEKGFRFEKESYVLYSENKEGVGFELRQSGLGKISALLRENGLEWQDGYPRDNSLCLGAAKKYPLMQNVVE